MVEAIRWAGEQVFFLDQTQLPEEINYVECSTMEQVADAINSMKVRGAPAIGAAAAFGMVLAALNYQGNNKKEFYANLLQAKETLAATRPTAVNLFWALKRMEDVLKQNSDLAIKEITAKFAAEAKAIVAEDMAMNLRLGEFGAELVPSGATIITHCNAGALATAGFGTALGVIRSAHQKGKVKRVWVDETRPLLQGARLTSWELVQEKIPATLITDSTAASLMQKGQIDLALVGADRITAVGDVANKIGTYGLAVLAYYHQIPFYVAAPWSTLDLSLNSGAEIPIEERAAEEITHFCDKRLAPQEMEVYNPAFDVTPHQLITAIITDRGIIRPPYAENVYRLNESQI